MALEKLQDSAGAANLSIIVFQRDVILHPPEGNTYDVIVVSRFLDRQIVPYIINAIKPGGLLFYQTWTRNKPSHIGPSNPDYLLAQDELLHLFATLAIVIYKEDTDPGAPNYGEAMLVAQKR